MLYTYGEKERIPDFTQRPRPRPTPTTIFKPIRSILLQGRRGLFGYCFGSQEPSSTSLGKSSPFVISSKRPIAGNSNSATYSHVTPDELLKLPLAESQDIRFLAKSSAKCLDGNSPLAQPLIFSGVDVPTTNRDG